MADAQLKEKIRDALQRGLFNDPEDVAEVSDADGRAGDEDVHVVVISRKFDGRRLRERTELIWSALERGLSADEWGRVTLSVGVSPDKVNGATINDITVI